MKPDEQLAEMDERHGRYHIPADWFNQEGGYLVPQGDQSWREQEALRIVPAHEKFGAGQTANDDAAPSEQIPDSESGGHGLKGAIFALLAVPIVAFAIAALTSPGILSAVFRPAHRSEVSSISKSAGATANPMHAPAPALPAEPAASPQIRPAPATAPKPSTASTAPVMATQSPPGPDIGPELSAAPTINPAPDTNTVSEAASKPSTRPVPRAVGHFEPDEHGRGGFYAKVIQPDGTLRNQYFASKSKPAALPSKNATGRGRIDRRNTGGFYAMVAEPDGTMEYRYFSSKPSR
jgi:hypothetical protein